MRGEEVKTPELSSPVFESQSRLITEDNRAKGQRNFKLITKQLSQSITDLDK